MTYKCYRKLDPGSNNSLWTVWDQANASLLSNISLNKFQWHLNKNTTIFIHENAFRIFLQMVAICLMCEIIGADLPEIIVIGKIIKRLEICHYPLLVPLKFQ